MAAATPSRGLKLALDSALCMAKAHAAAEGRAVPVAPNLKG